MGVVEFDVFSGERVIPAEHPVLRTEATFAGTLEIIATLNARRTIVTHIEESDRLSHDDLTRLASQLQASEQAIEFAYDTMIIDV
jgi:phosphoribosyl 1,2-cyclic phosphate phosphodiesterase